MLSFVSVRHEQGYQQCFHLFLCGMNRDDPFHCRRATSVIGILSSRFYHCDMEDLIPKLINLGKLQPSSNPLPLPLPLPLSLPPLGRANYEWKKKRFEFWCWNDFVLP